MSFCGLSDWVASHGCKVYPFKRKMHNVVSQPLCCPRLGRLPMSWPPHAATYIPACLQCKGYYFASTHGEAMNLENLFSTL